MAHGNIDDMVLSESDVEKIQINRGLVEIRLSALLAEAGSTLTVEDYKRAIFDGPNKTEFRTYLLEALDVFGTDIESVSEEIVSVIQDAWNYFPQRSLGGKCPAELFIELNDDDR